MTSELISIATLLGGAAVDTEELNSILALAPRLYCVDGGANTALSLNLSPMAVIGDLDSLSDEAATKYQDLLCPVDDQNSTDFEKSLSHVSDKVLICIGFLGQRLDHSIAAMNALAKFPNTRAVLVGDGDICFLAPRKISFETVVGDRVSLFPLSPTRAKSHGLLWPLDPLSFAPSGQIATSNKACESRVELYDISGEMLVILPRRYLPKIIEIMVNMRAG